MGPKKRKRDSSETSGATNVPTHCVIHFPDSSEQGFTPLTEERLSKLKDICKTRLALPADSKQRMSEICEQIPDALEDGYGYHRDCHRRFTAHVRRPSADPDSEPGPSRPPRVPSDESEKHIFKPDCIFCGTAGYKKIKQGGTWTTEPTSRFEFEGGDTILKVAEEKGDFDLLRRIKGFDLFACEAQYHRSCRKNYTRDPSAWQSTDIAATSHQAKMEAVHANAFSCVCDIVDANILQKMAVMKLDHLRDSYIDHLRGTEYSNEGYRSQKLKAKLMKQYGKKISFQPLRSESGGSFETYLVFNSMADLGKAVMQAYLLGKADKTRDVALSLRSDVQKAHRDSIPLPWPPSARDVENCDITLPEDLEKFLLFLITGKQAATVSLKNSRLVESIGQDLCRAVTNGHWKLPKHILLCMTLRHLFRSAELTNLFNRFGHCENYSFSLELETALANALQGPSNILSPQIIRNPPSPSVFHSDFDNFDENTASGSIHTSHGIMLQEVGPLTKRQAAPTTEDIGQDTTSTSDHAKHATARSGERSLRLEGTQVLPECYITQKQSPPFNLVKRMCADGEATMKEMALQNLLWMIMRMHSAQTDQKVPGWAGFISMTGEIPSHTTTIDYYPVINCPITEYKAVQECLRYSEEATKEVGQRYTISSFDLGVCMKAYPLIWKNPERYKDHIVMIGSFHVVCAFMKMVGKKMEGSGLSDVLLEAGLMTSGSVHAVLAGKQYNRGITCHKTLLEALERLLLQASSLENTISDNHCHVREIFSITLSVYSPHST